MNKKRKIFIVDDDLVFLEMLEELLSVYENYEVFAYQSGEECLENIHLRPELIVLDFNLSAFNAEAMNGIDVLKRVKQIDRFVKIVMLTGMDDLKVIYEVNKLNVDDFIIKGANTFQSVPKVIKQILA